MSNPSRVSSSFEGFQIRPFLRHSTLNTNYQHHTNMKGIIFLSLSVLTLLLFVQIDVLACSCSIDPEETLEQGTKARLKNAKGVFSGEVIEINKIPQSSYVSVKIQVKESWKNVLPKEINITSEFADGASCGYRFQVGKSYLVLSNISF